MRRQKAVGHLVVKITRLRWERERERESAIEIMDQSRGAHRCRTLQAPRSEKKMCTWSVRGGHTRWSFWSVTIEPRNELLGSSGRQEFPFRQHSSSLMLLASPKGAFWGGTDKTSRLVTNGTVIFFSLSSVWLDFQMLRKHRLRMIPPIDSTCGIWGIKLCRKHSLVKNPVVGMARHITGTLWYLPIFQTDDISCLTRTRWSVNDVWSDLSGCFWLARARCVWKCCFYRCWSQKTTNRTGISFWCFDLSSIVSRSLSNAAGRFARTPEKSVSDGCYSLLCSRFTR